MFVRVVTPFKTISGTPIQNSLSEYRHLLVYAAGSTLELHDNDEDESEEFRQLIQNPIERGAARDATDVQKRRAISLTRSLHEAARPFVLRRTCSSLSKQTKNGIAHNSNHRYKGECSSLHHFLTSKERNCGLASNEGLSEESIL